MKGDFIHYQHAKRSNTYENTYENNTYKHFLASVNSGNPSGSTASGEIGETGERCFGDEGVAMSLYEDDSSMIVVPCISHPVRAWGAESKRYRWECPKPWLFVQSGGVEVTTWDSVQ